MVAIRIGLFGGTFDPIHNAHVVAAAEARHAARLDKVLLVVANQPWQKTGTRPVTPAEVRYELVAAGVADVDGLEASRIEIDRGGESFTVDTVEQLLDEQPSVEVHVIVGADVHRQLDTWHRIDDLRQLAHFIVVNRGQGGLAEADDAALVEIPDLAISGTDIRRRVAEGRPVDGLVPPAALRLIRMRGLYAGLG
ncbi:MAG: nicotinate-nucleotide adenylyltransferase [Actinomycetota bacterium]